MRLRDILYIFKEYSDDISLKVFGISNDNNNKKVEGIFKLRTAIIYLEQTKTFKSELKEIKNINSIFLTTDDSISLPSKECDKLIGYLNQLKNKINLSITVLDSILPKQDPNSISIKLPEINDLKDLVKISTTLDKVFDQLLVNEFVEGKTKLQNFDTGSEWIELIFNSIKACCLIVSVVYSAILIKREHIKNKEILEIVRNRKITNDIYESLSKDLLEKNKELLNAQISQIAVDAGAPENDQEYRERIKFCINEISDLIDKGLKFFPSSKSPSEVKSKFPDFTKNSIEEMLPSPKQLPENTENKTDKEEDQQNV